VRAKILRTVDDGLIYHVGGTKPISVDVRLVFSTNKNLEKEVIEGRFHKDLFYRINVVNITLPPLRERKEDIPLLVDYFLEKSSTKSGVRKKRIDRAAMQKLITLDWPGNVRELENLIERTVALHSSEVITTRVVTILR
jgi:DNA-binding NtrC family response regulator